MRRLEKYGDLEVNPDDNRTTTAHPKSRCAAIRSKSWEYENLLKRSFPLAVLLIMGINCGASAQIASMDSSSVYSYNRIDLVGIIGLGASGLGVRTKYVYADFVVIYEPPPFFNVQPGFVKFDLPTRMTYTHSETGFGLGGVIPVEQFGILLGIDVHHIEREYFSNKPYEGIVSEDFYRLHYIIGGMYFSDSFGFGLGYGTGRSINANITLNIASILQHN